MSKQIQWLVNGANGEKLSKQTFESQKALYKQGQTFYYAVHRGEMAEWFNAPVLKTGEG